MILAMTIILSRQLKLRKNGLGMARQQLFDIKKVKKPRAVSTFTLLLKKKFNAVADTEIHAHIHRPTRTTSTPCRSRSQ